MRSQREFNDQLAFAQQHLQQSRQAGSSTPSTWSANQKSPSSSNAFENLAPWSLFIRPHLRLRRSTWRED
ncbi:hypothetical protein BC567DRAFT_234937 [Phyllosticta citribraziliensis]